MFARLPNVLFALIFIRFAKCQPIESKYSTEVTSTLPSSEVINDIKDVTTTSITSSVFMTEQNIPVISTEITQYTSTTTFITNSDSLLSESVPIPTGFSTICPNYVVGLGAMAVIVMCWCVYWLHNRIFRQCCPK